MLRFLYMYEMAKAACTPLVERNSGGLRPMVLVVLADLRDVLDDRLEDAPDRIKPVALDDRLLVDPGRDNLVDVDRKACFSILVVQAEARIAVRDEHDDREIAEVRDGVETRLLYRAWTVGVRVLCDGEVDLVVLYLEDAVFLQLE